MTANQSNNHWCRGTKCSGQLPTVFGAAREAMARSKKPGFAAVAREAATCVSNASTMAISCCDFTLSAGIVPVLTFTYP